MKKLFVFFLTSILFCMLFGCKERRNESGIDYFVRINKLKLNEQNGAACVVIVNAGTMLQANELIVNNVKYAVAFDENKPVYIQTHDTNFLTAEGLSINSTIAECLMKGIAVESEPGIGLFMRLKNGWRVYLSTGDEALHLSDKVLYFCLIDDKLSRPIDLQTWIDYIQSSEPVLDENLQDDKVFIIPIPENEH